MKPSRKCCSPPENIFAKIMIWHPGVSWHPAMSGLICEERGLKGLRKEDFVSWQDATRTGALGDPGSSAPDPNASCNVEIAVV